MRICFVGDSHLGHVKPAWDETAGRFSRLEVDFKIERTYGDKPLVIRDSAAGKLDTPTAFEDVRVTYGEVLDCARYEVFVVFGMHYSMNTLARSYTQFRSDGHTQTAAAYMLSQAAYQASANDLLMNHKAGRIVKELRARTDKPVVYVQQPHPLEWIADRTDLDFPFFRNLVSNADDAAVESTYRKALEHLRSLDVHVRPQPDQTRSGSIFTRREFGLADADDLSSDSLYSRGDYYHMNKAYGLLVLADLFESETRGLFRP